MMKPRQSYRKNLKVGGTLVIGASEIEFMTKNVSLNGFHACCENTDQLETGDIVFVRLPTLNIEGVASTAWMVADPGQMCHIGFKFLKMRGVGESGYLYRAVEQRAWVG